MIMMQAFVWSKPLGFACAAWLEQLASVFASCGAYPLGLIHQNAKSVDKPQSKHTLLHQKGDFVEKGRQSWGSVHRTGDFVEKRALESGSDLRSCYATLSLKKLQIDKKQKNLHVWYCAHAVFFALLWGRMGRGDDIKF